MANIQINYRSACLTRPVNVHLIFPNDVPAQFRENNPHYARPTKTLFVLHGYTADSTEWLYNSCITEMSLKYNLAVVLPNCDISFYLNQKGAGFAFGQYVGEELPNYLQRTFNLAVNCEDTFIMGESMGGFGALHTALAYPRRFSRAIALSSALIIHSVADMTPAMPPHGMADYDYFTATFGSPSEVEASDNNPETLVRKLKEANIPLPDLFMACGTEDFLLQNNRAFHNFLLKENVPVTYHEASGTHNFAFWNKWIEPSRQWALNKTKP